MIIKKLQNNLKKTVITFVSPYITYFIIVFFIISILFFGVEEFWVEYTSNEGIADITINNNGYLWPVPGYSYISSYYGNRIHPITKKVSFHDGIDIPAPQDTKVISPANAIVSKVYISETVGKSVEIESNEYRFVFYHLNSISVVVGQMIKKGNSIGGVGTTGTLSTGNHLHFTVYKNNEKINPLDIIDFNIEGS